MNMKIWKIVSCLVLLVSQITTQAADIRGTVFNKSRLNPKHVVVYLQGKFQLGGKNLQPLVINQKDRKFRPKFVVIPVGSSIIFSNDENDINHNVFSRSPTGNIELKTPTNMTL